jgi:hypothetical protein
MFRQLRALFHTQGPTSDFVHFHIDDEGRKVLCDESVCRPVPLPHPIPYLIRTR